LKYFRDVKRRGSKSYLGGGDIRGIFLKIPRLVLHTPTLHNPPLCFARYKTQLSIIFFSRALVSKPVQLRYAVK